MKKIFTITAIALLLISCYDDDASFAPNKGTDFSKNISDESNFYLSTPIELKVLEKDFVSQKLNYKIGDTLKLELNIPAIYQENATDFYDLRESTAADYYAYDLNFSYNFNNNTQKTIDLLFLDENPEIKELNLSVSEIRTHPVYKHLFINPREIKLEYNANENVYKSKIGFILSSATTLELGYDVSLSNYAYNTTDDKAISIHIPIISSLEELGKEIVVTE